MKDFNFTEGEVLLINKPLEWTSFDVVKKIRNTISRKTGIKKIKVGHAGTLDPLATGLLVICTGKFTKRINEFQNQEKEYTGTFILGATTPSFDKETDVDQTFDTSHITPGMIREAAASFEGDIDQIPPMFSAVMVDGKRAYKHARNDEFIELKPRTINISRFEITRIEMPEVDFRVVCSKGTYIRSLARDLGKIMNSGAYLSNLFRTRIGSFQLSEAINITQFELMMSRGVTIQEGSKKIFRIY